MTTPPILVIQLKRFLMQPSCNAQLVKNTKPVDLEADRSVALCVFVMSTVWYLLLRAHQKIIVLLVYTVGLTMLTNQFEYCRLLILGNALYKLVAVQVSINC